MVVVVVATIFALAWYVSREAFNSCGVFRVLSCGQVCLFVEVRGFRGVVIVVSEAV
jgi:hypothetical protein